VADQGIDVLKEEVDTLIVIPNDRLLELTDKRMSLNESFALADEFLRQGIQGISELITIPGIVNLDFADVKTIMAEGGAALMAVGEAEGDDRARLAAEQAISSQLLDVSIDGARGILFNITGGADFSLLEVNEAAAIIREKTHPDANVIFGAVIDEDMVDRIRVTVVATGFDNTRPQQRVLERGEISQSQLSSPTSSSKKPKQLKADKSEEKAVYASRDLSIPAFLRRR
jgi:cell division protein FtsZ